MLLGLNEGEHLDAVINFLPDRLRIDSKLIFPAVF